jgi:hypothetical protein
MHVFVSPRGDTDRKAARRPSLTQIIEKEARKKREIFFGRE